MAALQQNTGGAVLNNFGGGQHGPPAAAEDAGEDSDGLDPDHPDTCKICMDRLVGVRVLSRDRYRRVSRFDTKKKIDAEMFCAVFRHELSIFVVVVLLQKWTDSNRDVNMLL